MEVRPNIMTSASAHESIGFGRGMEGWLGKPRRLRSRHSYPVLGSSGSAISAFDSVLGLGARARSLQKDLTRARGSGWDSREVSVHPSLYIFQISIQIAPLPDQIRPDYDEKVG